LPGLADSQTELFVSAHLSYSEWQMGVHIKPNSNLLIEIELMEVLTCINRRL
jgi:peptidylprolyl isomerase